MDKLLNRIKDLESKYTDLEDQIIDSSTNITDLYDTINKLKNSKQLLTNNKYRNNLHSNSSNSDSDSDYLDSKEEDSIIQKNIYNKKNNNINNNKSKLRKNMLSYLESKTISKLQSKSKSKLSNKNKYIKFIDNLLNVYYDNTTTHDIQIYKELLDHYISLDIISRDEFTKKLENISNLSINSKSKLLKILESDLTPYNQKKVLSKLKTLENMDHTDSEYFKLSQWLDNILDIPFNKYIIPKYISQPPSEIISNARNELNKVIFGQNKTKQHILEIIARMISNPNNTGHVFAVEGEPGVGKTSLIKDGLSKVLGLPFIFISLGGSQDSSYLIGDNYTYIGSKPGIIIQYIKQSQCLNPIFYFDELDKISTTERGQEIVNLLIHLTDTSQNQFFQDHYMDGIQIDLSRAIFVFSYNDKSKISPILLDRMEIIKFTSYSFLEKKIITMKYLFPKILKKFYGLRKIDIKFNSLHKNKILNKIISLDTNKNNKNNNNNNKKNKNMLNIDYIMRRRNRTIMKNKNTPGGVRYISRRLEKIIARLNIQYLESVSKNESNIQNTHKIIINKDIIDEVLET